MPGRVGSHQAPVVSKHAVTPRSQASVAPPPAKEKPGSDYEAAKKKPVNMTGNFKPVSKAPLPIDPDLAAMVGVLQRAVSGGVSKPQQSVAAVIKKIAGFTRDSVQHLEQELKKLSPEQRKQVWDGLPAKLREAAVKALEHPSTPLGTNGGTPLGTNAVAMLHVQSMSDADLHAAAADMRAGKLPNEGLQLAISTELAARTPWGKANPDQLAYQRELVVSGKVSFAKGRGMARTETDGSVTLEQNLAKSPEGLAATLAHEAVHSRHATAWGMNQSVYTEETSGNLAGAAVWSDLRGKGDDPNLTTDQRDGLNDYADQYKASGEDGVQARVAAEYAKEASKLFLKKGNDAEAAKVRDVIAQLKDDPGAVKAMKPEYAQEIAQALLRLNPTEAEVKELGKTFKNLPEAARKALPELIKALPEDARKVLLDGLNGN